MLEQWILGADVMFQDGFLLTRAPFYADSIISFLALLPIFIIISVLLVRREYYKTHQALQIFLFLLTICSLFALFYMINYKEGFDVLLQKSSVEAFEASTFLILYIITVIVSITMWFFTIFYALNDRKRKALPGVYSKSHAKAGKRVFISILFLSATSVGIYWILFMA